MLIAEAATAVSGPRGSRFTRGCAQSLQRLRFVGQRMTKQIPPQCPDLPSFFKIKSSVCPRSFTQVHP